MADETVSTPQEVLDRIPQCVAAFDHAIAQFTDETPPVLVRELRAVSPESADELRKLLPHLDDATLTVIAGYIMTVAGQTFNDTGCPDMRGMYFIYAMVGQQFAEFIR